MIGKSLRTVVWLGVSVGYWAIAESPLTQIGFKSLWLWASGFCAATALAKFGRDL
jgi:hypothetical protein